MMQQGSDDWLVARSGHATASRFKDILAKVKSGESASRRNYRMAVVTERLVGGPIASFTNTAMQHGTDHEPFARMAYESRTGAFVDEVGFLTHPTIAWCGGSPDGLINDDGIIEIKCPYVSTVHVETIQGGMPSEHLAQCHGLLWISGRQWVDFVSFDPRMPEHLQLHVERIARNEKYIETLAAEVCIFLAEVDTLHAGLMARAPVVQEYGDAMHVSTQG